MGWRRSRARRAFEYTFPTIDAYLAAQSGADPLGYTTFQQDFGDLDRQLQLGVLRALRPGRLAGHAELKLLYGLRYDLFDVPSARPFAANPYSQDFTIDKNNLGPRAGLSWSLDAAGAHGRCAPRPA